MTSEEGIAIHEYGVDPGVINSWERFSRFFVECCGFGEGRVISAIPSRRRWGDAVLEACAAGGMPPIKRKSVEERLRRGEDRFFEREAPEVQGEREWLDAALAEHEREALRLIIARADLGHADVETPEEMDIEGRWKATKTGPVQRSAAAIELLCRKLLMQAKKLSFVDPYLDVKGRVLRALLPQAWRGRSPSRVDLHTTRQSGLNGHIEDSLASLVPAGRYVKVYVWAQESLDGAFDKVHDRFLLTELGGISLGWGFKEATDSVTQASLMSQESSRAWQARLRAEQNVYRLEREPFEVWGTGS